jgi:hypothetical protein
MTKEEKFLGGLALFLILGTLLDVDPADAIFIAAATGFFLLCVAYTEWCSRL